MTFFADITFVQVCLTVITIAAAERAVLPFLPETLVGPKGLLLKTA